jgi:hypothetical protein
VLEFQKSIILPWNGAEARPFSAVEELGMYDARMVLAVSGLCAVLGTGCGGGASRVRPVEIDASSASSEAIELYDKDGDGALAGGELNAVPGLKKNLQRYDRDSDQRVTGDEIAARLGDWADNKLALMGCTYIVTLDGRPLADAEVTLVPEAYLGPNVKPATGVTGPNGLTRLSHAPEDLPKSSNGRPIPGVKGGTYKLVITHPSKQLPAKYNTATELGEEIAYDINPNDAPNSLPLSSK